MKNKDPVGCFEMGYSSREQGEAGPDGLAVTALRAVGNFIKRLRGGEKNDDEPPRSQRNAWLG